MNAEKIVDALLEADDEKAEKPKKKLPPWLAKIKGEPVDDEDGGEKKDDAKSGASKGGGGGAKSSDSTVGKTW